MTGIGQRLPMEKNDQGVWTATTGVLKPDIYSYSFSVDGATFTDPGNPQVKTAYLSAGQSLVHVPGPVSSCGTADSLIGVNRQFKDWLKSKDVKFIDIEVPDAARVWPLWRQNLTELAPLLFQGKGQ